MIGLSGFYPNLLKNMPIERVIEKAVKKYTREVKYNNFSKNF